MAPAPTVGLLTENVAVVPVVDVHDTLVNAGGLVKNVSMLPLAHPAELLAFALK